MQEIVVKALLVLSVQNSELSDDIRGISESNRLLSERVNRIVQTQYKLAGRLIEWEYGGKRELLISELKEHKKTAVIGVYAKFVSDNRQLNTKESKNFSAALFRAFGMNPPEERDVSYIDKLLPKEQELLYKLLQSWLYLAAGDFGRQEIFDRFAVSNKRKQELCGRIRAAVEMQGAENYIDWYAAQEPLFEDDINVIGDDAIEFADTGIIKRYIDFDDEEIRRVIAQYEGCFGADKLDIRNPENREEIDKRIQRVHAAISREAVVGIYDCGCDVILTTHAMYADGKVFDYSQLNEDKIAIGVAGGEKYRLMLPDKNGVEKVLEINADMTTLKELLAALSKLRAAPTDEAVSFDKLPYSQRVVYYRLLLFIHAGSQLPVFDAYAKIAALEKTQEENRFTDFMSSGIVLPADTLEYRAAVADFFESVPYPSRQMISVWAMTTALETLSLSKWSNAVSKREEDLIFCMDYAGIGSDEKRKYKLLEDTTLEPYFIDDNLTGEKQTYFFKHSTLLTNPWLSGVAAVLTGSLSLWVQLLKADGIRKELIRAHLEAYENISNALFGEESAPAGVMENEREVFDKRVKIFREKL